jgi:hypothetical protein
VQRKFAEYPEIAALQFAESTKNTLLKEHDLQAKNVLLLEELILS